MSKHELIRTDVIVRAGILQVVLIVAIVDGKFEFLSLLEVVVDLELLDEVRIMVVPDDFGQANLLLNDLA